MSVTNEALQYNIRIVLLDSLKLKISIFREFIPLYFVSAALKNLRKFMRQKGFKKKEFKSFIRHKTYT